MAQMSKSSVSGMDRAVNKRDKVLNQITYNEKYPDLMAKELDAKNEQKRLALENAAKKTLEPLQAAASPLSTNNKLREEALEVFSRKQHLPRLAVVQSALRLEKKQGEKAAAKFREAKIAKLDKDLEAHKAMLSAKYPTNVPEAGSEQAIATLKAAKDEEVRKMETFLADCEKVKQDRLEKVQATMSAKNTALKSALDKANNNISRMCAPNAPKVPRGNIMSIQNVKMYFSGIKAVDDLSFDIKEGEIFGLIGPNGAGKTTLFNCITRFYKQTEGKLYYRDGFGNVVDLDHYKSHDVVKTGIVRTFQNLQLIMLLPVLDNLIIGAHTFYNSNLLDSFLHTKKLKNEERLNKELATEILHRMGLLMYKDMPAMSLPYGVLKKVELARTLMTKPRLIILDEPAAGLNDAETEKLADIIKLIREDFNCTVFLVEHDMNLVMNVCETVCAINFGKLLAIGSPEEIQANPLVQEAYLGAEESE